MGTTTSTVGFARSLGSTMGIALFGAVLNTRLASELESRVAGGDLAGGLDPIALVRNPTQVKLLPGPLRDSVSGALASAISDIYLVAIPFALVGFAAAWLLRELPLRTVAPIGQRPSAVDMGPASASVVAPAAPANVPSIEPDS